jgi:hypothetical protein
MAPFNASISTNDSKVESYIASIGARVMASLSFRNASLHLLLKLNLVSFFVRLVNGAAIFENPLINFR